MSVEIELQGTETDLPLIPEGDVPLQIVESSIGANKDKNGNNWNLKLATTTQCTSTDGRTINPNYPVYMTLALQAKEGSADPEAFKRSLSEAVDAIFKTDKTNRPKLTKALVEQAQGQLVIGHVYIDEYQGKKGNKIKRLKRVP